MHYSYEMSLLNTMNSRMHYLYEMSLLNNTMLDTEIIYLVFDKSIQRVEFIKRMRNLLCTSEG